MRRTQGRFLRIAAATILLLTVEPMGAAAAGRAPLEAGQAGAHSWIVTLNAGVDPSSRGRELAARVGGSAGAVFRHALHGFVFKGAAPAAAALARDPDVRTVVADRPIHAVAETTPVGIRRIAASDPTKPDAHDAGFTGAGARIAILDTGVDLTHPDLVPNLDTSLGKNCITAGPPQDGHGHGTHVAGIAAAVAGNNIGVVGVASSARIVPIKVLDDTGSGEWSNVICGIDYITGLKQDGDPSNDVDVANMSLGDTGSVGNCADGGLREAICTSVAAEIVYVAAAGNSTVDASTFIPAAFPEVITVSAMVDTDGKPGGLGGCSFFGLICDDALAYFSNYGSIVDVTAPGYNVYSTWTGGGYQYADGTSMAAPHVAGVAALVRAARPSLTPADVQDLLEAKGECPNGQWADAGATADCTDQGQWGNDPDGQAEPLVNALRAAQAAAGWDARPSIQITSPADGASVSGMVTVTASATDDVGVASVEFTLNGKPMATDTNGADGWSATWSSDASPSGAYTLGAVAVDGAGQRGSDSVDVRSGGNLGGDWVGTYGHDGYALLAWTSSSDLVLLPQANLTVEQGTRSSLGTSAEVRALESPDETERRVGASYDPSQVRLRLDFSSAYAGALHLYAVDWATSDRRQRFTVDDGSGAQLVQLSTSFHDGAWMHFPISVAPGGTVHVTVDKVAGANVVINGLFLGEGAPAVPGVPSAPQNLVATADSASVALSWAAPLTDGGSPITGYQVYRGTSPGSGTPLATLGNVLTYTDATAAPGTTYSYSVSALSSAGEGPRSVERKATLADVPGAQGDWVGTYGHDGYDLFAWTSTSDLAVLPQASLTVPQGTRSSLGSTSEVRALESPDQSERRVGAYYDASQVRLRLTFANAYSGRLHLYAVDWAASDRRQMFTVDDGSGAQVVQLSTSFHDGAWMHFPISVAAGGTVSITVDRLAGANALISGLFLGEAAQPPPTAPGAPTLTSATAGNAQVALAWTAPSDGGSPITGYTATASPGGATCSTTGATSCTVTGLTNGTSYSFTVTATNAVGTGPASNALSATPVAPPTAPGAPTLTSATAGNAQVALAWTAPSDGGSPITGYTATASPGGATCSTTGATSCTVTGLTNGTSYSFTVRATNAAGSGPESNALSATPAAPTTAPGAPTLVSATAGNAQVALSWTAPASDGGSPITGYTATASPGGAACSTAGTTSCTVTGLTNGTSYSFTVRATNAVGTGPASNALSATPATVPGAPQNLVASPHRTKGVNLSWSAPLTSGGATITAYRIYRGTSSGSWALLTSVGNVTTYRDAATKKAIRYYYVVRAVNAVGESAVSNEANATAK